jgi:type II secretory pathway component PulK
MRAMNASARPIARTAPRQQGAALVVGLLLLLVLTLLAISGMNSASLEFIMAGNEQYRSNAFQASEAGIEQTIQQGAFNPADAAPPPITGTLGAGDIWTTTVTPQLGGTALAAIWGNSWNSFSTYHFEINSIATSTRSANAVNLQGIAVISPWDPTVQPDPNLPSNLLQ